VGLTHRSAAANERDISQMYPAWRNVKMWANDMRANWEFAQQKSNPFYAVDYSFSQAANLVQEVGHNFGSFQNMECQSLKDVLTSIEDHGTGRVPLSSFYRVGLKGEWKLTESVDFLRSLGALDETNSPQVVIPNYIYSRTNCLSSSDFYSVCCFNECEGLMAHLERKIAGPAAVSSDIVAVIANLASDTVDAPRNISQTQLARLDDIAQFHGGVVPLHGRLFAQWMHHAYPRECPFPHVFGAVTPMNRYEWEAKSGSEDAEASEGEMFNYAVHAEDHSEADLRTVERKLDALPWAVVEELVTTGHHSLDTGVTGARPWFRSVAVIVVVASATASLFRMTSKATASLSHMAGPKAEKHLV